MRAIDVSAPHDPASWNVVKLQPILAALVAGDELAAMADERDDILVLTADLSSSNKTSEFASRHPDRFINVGIAEKNMITMAAGLATCGYVPYVSTFASFAGVLAAEQIRTDLSFPNLPVRVLAHHAGVALGLYGVTHHAIEDLAICRTFANLVVTSAADGPSLRAILRSTVDLPNPVYIRFGLGVEPQVYDEPPALEHGRFVTVREGSDVTIIATGIGVAMARTAAETLAGEGIGCRVLDAVYVKPLDDGGVLAAARETGGILTVEEHSVAGGLGGAVAEVLAEAGTGTRFMRHGFPAGEHPPMGFTNAVLDHYGLSPDGVAERVRRLLA